MMISSIDGPTWYRFITGCAVAQHCCKGDQPFQWENQKLNLSYFPNSLIFPHPKFTQMITSGISPDVQNLVKIRLRGASSQIGEIGYNVFFAVLQEKRLNWF